MGELIRKLIAGVIIGICVVLFLCAAMAVWDYNERQYDQKMMSGVIFDCIRNFDENGDPDAIIYPYIGSTKTLIFHTFESKCAGEIRSTQLTGFDSKEDAVKAGYSPCAICGLDDSGY